MKKKNPKFVRQKINLQTYHWVHFMVANLLLGVRPGLKSSVYTPWDSVGENWSCFFFFFSVRSYQFEIASGLQWGTWVHFMPSWHWDSIWLEPVQVPCRSRACCRSLCVHMCVSPVVFSRLHFLGVFQSHWLLIFFLPPFLKSSLSPEGRGLMKRSHLGMNAPRSFIPSTLSLYLFPSIAGGGVSDDGWVEQGTDLCVYLNLVGIHWM